MTCQFRKYWPKHKITDIVDSNDRRLDQPADQRRGISPFVIGLLENIIF